MKGDFDVTIMAIGEYAYAEHLLEEGIVVTGYGGTPFVDVGKVAFSFGFAFLSESFFCLVVFFLTAFLPLLQAVVDFSTSTIYRLLLFVDLHPHKSIMRSVDGSLLRIINDAFL